MDNMTPILYYGLSSRNPVNYIMCKIEKRHRMEAAVCVFGLAVNLVFDAYSLLHPHRARLALCKSNFGMQWWLSIHQNSRTLPIMAPPIPPLGSGKRAAPIPDRTRRPELGWIFKRPPWRWFACPFYATHHTHLPARLRAINFPWRPTVDCGVRDRANQFHRAFSRQNFARWLVWGSSRPWTSENNFAFFCSSVRSSILNTLLCAMKFITRWHSFCTADGG